MGPYIARTSAAIVLNMMMDFNKDGGFQLPVTFKCPEMIENANINLCFLKANAVW